MTERNPADYIEALDCDLELEAALREAYANNGPVVSLIAEFREQCTSRLYEALEEAREALSLAAAIPLSDPRCRAEVISMCERFGYGAVMSTASVEWRNRLGDLAGGEFCAGPCRSTAEKSISKIDASLEPSKEGE